MESSDYARYIRFAIIVLIVSIVAFQRWLVDRKEKETQETIDAFELVELYRKTYVNAYDESEASFTHEAYIDSALKSESGFRTQMGGFLQQHFSFKQMTQAISNRANSAIYDAQDVLPGMMSAAREKSAQNIKQIKASLNPNKGANPDKSRRRRRRR